MIVRSAVVIALISLAIPVGLGAFPKLGEWKSTAADQWSKFATSTRETMATAVAPLARPVEPLPRLLVEDSTVTAGSETPLGIAIDRPHDGAVVILSDYAPGTAFSVGDAWGDGSWLIPVAELPRARVRPPEGYAGSMQLRAALRLIDGSLADRQSVRIDWPSAAIRVPQTNAPEPRRLDPDEISLLLKRGQELLETGDIASARLALRRAAEAGDARAAYALAATYDPNVLRELRVYGAAPDLARARAWYEKAVAFGSREAPQRLEMLVSESR
jgi:TPR repeat protein